MKTKKNKDPFEGIFNGLQDEAFPTNEQKERMLNNILTESRFQKKLTTGLQYIPGE